MPVRSKPLMKRPLRLARAITVLVVAAAAGADGMSVGAKHPALATGPGGSCTGCHAEELEGRTTHPGVDDCSRCHEVSGAASGTEVRFVSPWPDLCIGCHPGVADAAGGKLAFTHAPVRDACSNCHRPHASDEPRLLKDPARDLCLSCHEADRVAKAHPVPLGRTECGACHAPHGSSVKGMLAGEVVHAPFGGGSCEACHQQGRLSRAGRGRRSPQAATCLSCHSETQEWLRRSSVHAPVAEGQCSACHDPHLSSEPKLAKARGAALCIPCHADVARVAAAPGGHAPAAKGCNACHDPHGAREPGLLAQPVPLLCAGCHRPGREELVAKHLGADLARLDCASCHDPHGAPNGKLFLAPSRHAPFVLGSCDSCHEGDSATTFAGGGGRALCTACHAEIEEAAAKARVRHAALDGECTLCHAPHASGRPKLARGRGGEACGSCHEDQVAAKGEVAHGAITSLGCEACHAPHGGEGEKLLNVSGDGLCLACHYAANLRPDARSGLVKLLDRFAISADEAARIRTVFVGPSGPVNHPVGGHRSSGPPPPSSKGLPRLRATFEGEMKCLTCHDPHKGNSSRLLVGGAASAMESCLQCHPK